MEAGEAQHAGRITTDGLLRVESRRQNGSWLVEARGEIDLATIETLKAELQEHSGLPIVLDLKGVEFMDSSGIKLMGETSWQLTLGDVSHPVEDLIHMCADLPIPERARRVIRLHERAVTDATPSEGQGH